MAVFEGAVLDDYVFAGELAPRKLMPRFYGNIVIADINQAFGNEDASGHAWVNRIGVRRTRRSQNGDVGDDDILALVGHEMEEGRVFEGDVADNEIFYAGEPDQPGT